MAEEIIEKGAVEAARATHYAPYGMGLGEQFNAIVYGNNR